MKENKKEGNKIEEINKEQRTEEQKDEATIHKDNSLNRLDLSPTRQRSSRKKREWNIKTNRRIWFPSREIRNWRIKKII